MKVINRTMYADFRYTGSTKLLTKQHRLKKEKEISVIETSIPTAKTANAERYKVHICRVFENLKELLEFYDANTSEGSFFLYQGRQRAPEKLVDLLTNGDAKYNKEKRKKRRGRKEKAVSKSSVITK